MRKANIIALSVFAIVLLAAATALWPAGAQAGPTAQSAPDTQPTFGSQTINPQTYTTGAALTLDLPVATGGNAPLTYTLSPAAPAGMIFFPLPSPHADRRSDHGASRHHLHADRHRRQWRHRYALVQHRRRRGLRHQ